MKKILFLMIMVLMFVPAVHAEWSGDISMGANLQSGNTDKASISLGASATQRIDSDRFTGKIAYNYAEENDALTVRNVYGKGQYDRFINESLYAYVSVELQKDNFKNLNLRTIVGPGMGLQVWDSEDSALSVEGGVAYFSEDVRAGVDTQWLTARAGSNYRQRLTDTIKFNNEIIVNPSLEDVGEYTLRNEAVLMSAITESWSMKLSNVLQYDSNPSAGIEKKDLKWSIGAMYNF